MSNWVGWVPGRGAAGGYRSTLTAAGLLLGAIAATLLIGAGQVAISAPRGSTHKKAPPPKLPLAVKSIAVHWPSGHLVGVLVVANRTGRLVQATRAALSWSPASGGSLVALVALSVPRLHPHQNKKLQFSSALPVNSRPGKYRLFVCLDVGSRLQPFSRKQNCVPAGVHLVTARHPTQHGTPPRTTLTSAPSGFVRSTSASLSFTSNQVGSTFQCALDGGPWLACASPQQYAALSQGSHTFSVRAMDPQGLADPGPPSASWTVDTIAPAPTVTSPAGGTSTNRSQPTFTGSAGIAPGDLPTVTVRLYVGSSTVGAALQTNQVTPTAGSWSTQPAYPLPDGTYTLQAQQADSVGNLGLSAPQTFVIDTTPPTVGMTQPANGAVVTTAVPTFAGAAGTAPGDLPTITVQVWSGSSATGGPLLTLTATASGAGWALTPTSGLPDGTYTAQARQSDAAGNTGVSAANTFQIDSQGPAVTLTNPAAGSTVTTSLPVLSGTAGTAPGDQPNVAVTIYAGAGTGGAVVQSVYASASGGFWSATPYNPLPNGVYTAQAQQQNGSGAVGISSANTFTLSAAPPAPTLTTPANGSVLNTSTPAFSGTASTASTSLPTVTINIYHGAQASGTPVQSLSSAATGASWSVTGYTVLPDGVYTAVAQQSDVAGNVGSSSANTFTIDTTPPSVSLTVPSDGAMTGPTPNLSGAAATGSGDLPQITINVFSGSSAAGTPVETLSATASSGAWSTTATVALGEGTYTAQAQQSDQAGNVGTSLPVTFTVSTVTITTNTLANGIAGLQYQSQVGASGGQPPYTYSATGLPSGLSISSISGVITGSPVQTRTSSVQLSVSDSAGFSTQATLALDVPSAVPANCANQSCADVTPDGQTVNIDGSSVSSVATNPSTGQIASLTLSGTTPAPQQIIVVSASNTVPSGLSALVTGVTANPDGTSTVSVQPAGLADAYDTGTIQTIGDTTSLASAKRHAGASPTLFGLHRLAGKASLSCSAGVSSSLHGLDVVPSLAPSVAAIWKHPFFGGGGLYPGTGGLQIFQFDLDGSITVNAGITISGSATCTIHLPGYEDVIPAGNLGAVVLGISPTLTLKTDGAVDIRSSVSLSCGAEYRWDLGQESRGSYCGSRYTPLQLSSNSGVNVTASATLDTSVSLDGIAGISGNLTASLHAGYTPPAHPVAEIDASATYDLNACLLCFWSGSPATVTLVSGTLFNKVLATFGSVSAPSPTGPSQGAVATLPSDAFIRATYPSPANHFVVVFESNSNPGVSYIGYLTPAGGLPSSVLSIPTGVSGMTFGPDGTIYATIGSLTSYEGGELVSIPPDLSAANEIHSWGAGPNGYDRYPGAVVYESGTLYVDAITPNVYFSCQELLSALTTTGADITSAVPPVDCGGLYDAANGQLSVLDEGYAAISWLDPGTLNVLSTQSPGSGSAMSVNEGADGSYAEATGSDTACPDLTVSHVADTGIAYQAALTSTLGLQPSDACNYGGAVITTDGVLRVVAADQYGLVVDSIVNGAITQSVIGPATATQISVIADGSGGLVVTYGVPTSCVDSNGNPQQCMQTVIDVWRNGVTTTVASLGGTYNNSVQPSSAPQIINGQILFATDTGPYYCGPGCGPYGEQGPFWNVYAASVVRQKWHNPA